MRSALLLLALALLSVGCTTEWRANGRVLELWACEATAYGSGCVDTGVRGYIP